MGYEVGIEKSKKALAFISSEETIEERLDKAFDAITSINAEDTSIELLKDIVNWGEKYSVVQGFGIKMDGIPKTFDKNKELIILSNELVALCHNIINHNSKDNNEV